MDFDVLCSPITGKRLIRLFENENFCKKIYYQKVASEPEEALGRLRRSDGITNLSSHGVDSKSIIKVREAIFDTCTSNIIGSLAIVAPHTHWNNQSPIIYTWLDSENRYIIGEHILLTDDIYIPVSFAFDKSGPMPYEWADSSVIIDKMQWLRSLEAIRNLNIKLAYEALPLGVSIDFRFKENLFIQSDSTLETPIDSLDDKFYGFSQITKFDSFLSDDASDSEQVSWHPYSDKALGLNGQGSIALSRVRQLLDSVNSAQEKQDIIMLLKKQLKIQ